MPKLNPLLHQELRLAIVSFLIAVESADFKKLLEISKASKGNLSIQLSKLEEAGYLKITKSFKNKYPHTSCSLTANGKTAFEDYLSELKKMLSL